MDDDGKMWFVDAGGEARAGQLPRAHPLRAPDSPRPISVRVPEEFQPGFDVSRPIAGGQTPRAAW